MKKVIMLAMMILALMMIPAASFAKTIISDNDLGNVTAQTGVSITFSNLSISSLSFSTLSYGDNDGITTHGGYNAAGYTSAGWFGAKGVTITKGGSNVIDLVGVMNIDVGSNGSAGNVGGIGVQIVLPAITIGGSAGMNITGTLVMAQDKTLSTNAGTLATVDIERFKTYMNGTVTVFAH